MGRVKSDRIYLRVNSDLKEAVQDYCKRRHTTVSEIVSRFFIKLLEKELVDNKLDAEQI